MGYMVQRIQLPRLSKADAEGVLRAHQFIEQIIGALRTTNWAGSAACIALAGNVDVVLCQLYNKVEAAILRPVDESTPQSPGEVPPASSPDDDANQAPKTPPEEALS